MMKPIFNKNTDFIGWIKEDKIWDNNLKWVAFISKNFVFSTECDFIGILTEEGSFNDQNGKAFAWIQGGKPQGSLRPLHPLRPIKPIPPIQPIMPIKPLQPLKPLTPLGGWSEVRSRF